MKKTTIVNLYEFIQLLEDQKVKGFKFPNLEQIIFHLSQQKEENDTFIPIGTGEFIALIRPNIFPDELQFINKVGNFIVVVMEVSHLNRVFLNGKSLITWTIPQEG